MLKNDTIQSVSYEWMYVNDVLIVYDNAVKLDT